MDVNEQMAAPAAAFADCRKAFTAMGDENRQLIILALLRHSGGMRVGELMEDLLETVDNAFSVFLSEIVTVIIVIIAGFRVGSAVGSAVEVEFETSVMNPEQFRAVRDGNSSSGFRESATSPANR